MSKRQGTELNHDNWDKQDDVKEEAGVFKPLADSELQNRVIRRAKRSMKDSNAEPEPNATPSPFSAFSGFSRSSSTPSFSFQVQAKKPDSSSSGGDPPKQEETKKNGCGFRALTSPSDSEGPSTKLLTSDEQAQAKGRSLEYFRTLQNLNESVLKWIQMHFDKNPCCDFTPVFNDYKTHLHKIDCLYPVQNSTDKKITAFPEMSKNTSFKLPQPVASNRVDSSSSSRFFEATSDSEKKDDIDKEMLYGAGFASNTTNTSTFSFGIKESPTSTSTGSKSGPTSSSGEKDNEETTETSEKPAFSFGLQKPSDDSAKSTKPGLFGSGMKPFSFGFPSAAPVNNNSEPRKEEEYVPPKNEFSAVSEDDAVYSKRCKLFFQKDGSYMDKGVGTLYLKPIDGKMQLLIRADTNLGNVLLNIMLSSSLPMERSGKNNVLVVCVPNPPIDVKDPDSKKAVPLLIRVKTAEDADEVLEKFNEYKS